MHGLYDNQIEPIVCRQKPLFEPWPLPVTLQSLTCEQPHRHLAGRLHFASLTMGERQMHGYD